MIIVLFGIVLITILGLSAPIDGWKTIIPRLRDPASLVPLPVLAISHNLGPIFLNNYAQRKPSNEWTKQWKGGPDPDRIRTLWSQQPIQVRSPFAWCNWHDSSHWQSSPLPRTPAKPPGQPDEPVWSFGPLTTHTPVFRFRDSWGQSCATLRPLYLRGNQGDLQNSGEEKGREGLAGRQAASTFLRAVQGWLAW